MTEPTKEQLAHAEQASAMFKDIAQLLKDGIFPGFLAPRVAGSIAYLERSAAAMVPVAKAEDKRARKALKRTKLAAAPEDKADGQETV